MEFLNSRLSIVERRSDFHFSHIHMSSMQLSLPHCLDSRVFFSCISSSTPTIVLGKYRTLPLSTHAGTSSLDLSLILSVGGEHFLPFKARHV